ncbi:receptor-like protein Cf-9 homolog [Solanum stenotomum]|uniref:receptor-like protein Cf-9 homolog n=1 Tax=Solanum stenotomum TaxID=172797 RepID=UPI0020D086B1|nr:receptor-like protein Cf-9 homolog [Solanum stenotomum]XP_049407373.1 receptor-like protein Cf-9 homolog [Solanum stenotomum]
MGHVNLVFFMIYPFLCQLAFSSSLPHLCPKDQALSLLQFKHMFTIDPNAPGYRFDITYHLIQSYPKTLSWNKSTDCCSWDGVHCDEMTGQVIELNLRFSKLQGKFHSNSSLFQLSNLKRLDLSYNDFSGSLISPKFGELSSLMHLDLLDSSFTGLIPEEISRLSKLQVLRISSDLYDLRFGPHNFKLLLKNLTQLRVLDLSDVSISSAIPLNFSSYLTNLELSYMQIYGILPESVFHLSNLETLYLSDNPQLTVRFPTTKWNSSASLMELDLYRVNFIGKIPESFSHLTSLRRLTIASCNLSGSIPKPLWNLTSIEKLDLGYNHLEGPISDFFTFGKLWWLSLGKNNFDGQLEFLSFNRSWAQLKLLDFSSNSLTGPIPSNVSGLQNLGSLSLSSNHLNGNIPSWIFSLPLLGLLDLRDNHFNGNILDFKSKSLFLVILKQNKLQGPIPKSLLNQKRLQFLVLSQNNLSGQIASTVCNLKTLQVLDLGSNNLEGTIPLCLGEMSELWALDLSNNSLSGTINTNFSIGTINTNFSIGNQLRVIKFDGNKLEGKVPQSLINCKNLEFLDLGNNELSDTFPKWLGTLPYLQILNLRSNKFYGPIKDSRSDKLFAQILIIDLSSNVFSGDLPVRLFENFEAMKVISENSGTREYVGAVYSPYYTNSMIVTTKGRDLELPQVLTTEIIIDFSMNRFEGHIPSIIGDLIGLRALNLSRNLLEGHIPMSLHQLSVLESLDLSSNKISGEIPHQLASLTSLEVLNLSHNHLVGCIPKGKQFEMFENSSYQGNDRLRGFPLSKDCGGDEGVPQAATPYGIDQEEEGDSTIISWQVVLMGYGCGLVIGLSIIYTMLSTQYPAWFSRMDVELEHKILTRMRRHKKRH